MLALTLAPKLAQAPKAPLVSRPCEMVSYLNYTFNWRGTKDREVTNTNLVSIQALSLRYIPC